MASNQSLPDTDCIDAIAHLAEKAAGGIVFTALARAHDDDGLPPQIAVAVREGKEPQIIDVSAHFEKFRTAPRARKGVAKMTTLQSFIDLVNRHKDIDSAVFARTEWPEPALTAVIDYHQAMNLTAAQEAEGMSIAGKPSPRFGEHRIGYTFPLTDEFKEWVEQDGNEFDQAEFAAFLEDHSAELAAPTDAEAAEYKRLFGERVATPNEVVDLARMLEVHVSSKAKNGARLKSGERTVEFTEEHTNAKGEAIDIPGVFMVAVPAFVDGDTVRIPARLRYRIAGGAIVWIFQLYRWEFWLRQQVQNDLARVARETGLPTYEGKPEA